MNCTPETARPDTVAVLPCAGDPDRVARSLAEVANWFQQVSLGAWQPRFLHLPAVALPRPWGWYRATAAGKGPPPHNSQSLMADALTALPTAAHRNLTRANGRCLALVPPGFAPHTWHLPRGGHPLAPGNWMRRYALIPIPSPLGTFAHELGHLLFDWPDLAWDSVHDRECLMARGATGVHAAHPIPPCAPLLVDVEWRRPVPLTRDLTAANLAPEEVGTYETPEHTLWVELRRDSARPRLLLYARRRPASGGSPRCLGSMPLTGSAATAPLLGLAAPFLRTLARNGSVPP